MARIIEGCKNHYTEETLFDYFMEREEDMENCSKEDMENCSNCPNLRYVGGTMTCAMMERITSREEERK